MDEQEQGASVEKKDRAKRSLRERVAAIDEVIKGFLAKAAQAEARKQALIDAAAKRAETIQNDIAAASGN